MKRLQCRLRALERALRPPSEQVVYAVAVGTERGDLDWVGGQWVECDARAILARNWPTKVYVGFIP